MYHTTGPTPFKLGQPNPYGPLTINGDHKIPLSSSQTLPVMEKLNENIVGMGDMIIDQRFLPRIVECEV